jgi:hypothetical protein
MWPDNKPLRLISIRRIKKIKLKTSVLPNNFCPGGHSHFSSIVLNIRLEIENKSIPFLCIYDSLLAVLLMKVKNKPVSIGSFNEVDSPRTEKDNPESFPLPVENPVISDW